MSLNPLTVDEALAALLSTPPPAPSEKGIQKGAKATNKLAKRKGR